MNNFRSAFPYGLAAWVTVQTIYSFQGKFEPAAAASSLALIFVVIVGTEHIAFWIINKLRKKGPK